MNKTNDLSGGHIPLDSFFNAFFKRSFDMIFSLFALLLLLPVQLIIALLIKLTSRGPVFYIPQRVGAAGKTFNLYKFRTMYSSHTENRSTEKNDVRVTKLGVFLRRWNLDELPQFYNVLKGQMSIVGPRPHRVDLDKELQDSIEMYTMRYRIKPGITGWAQVNGWRGPTKTEEQRKQRTQHDLWYIKHWSLWLDIKIIIMTLFWKKSRKNAF